jgi:hypothetical protein
MADRNSAVDRSNMNKIYKPIAGYFGNVVKEGKEAVKAYSQSLDATDKAKNFPPAQRPALKAAASAAGKKAEAERGQFLGSLVGKRYDSKGNRK